MPTQPCTSATKPGSCDLDWWVINSEALLKMLYRAYAGEDPDLLYIEEYANSTTEEKEG